ncbi:MULTISPECIES: hypothetical protein [Paenibacillus]|uniref:Uncharacterized protein n=1 Tax=Paenibacillus terrae TaxID=159743 RepID=A0A0D7X2U5_9BACL|nr:MULTISPECIES: hypothetical protein [Paenibacillus]KJD44352.1 hypothetical protein QD47_17675 [Paenibacillus terrae]
MKWQEVQQIFPNQFVKFEIIHSEEKDSQEFIDDVAVIGPVSDEEATKELLNSKEKTLIYHTSKDRVIVKVRKNVGLRRYL